MSRKPQSRLSRIELDYETDNPGDTPCAPTVNEAENLHLACVSGDRAAAQLAIQRGADVREAGNTGWRPLHLAATHAHVDVARLLLLKGSWVDARSSTSRTCSGATALHVAVCAGDVEMIRLLLRAGADPNTADEAGFHPLHTAAAQGHYDAVRALLKGGAWPTAQVADHTALDLARQGGHGQVVGLLQQFR